MRFSFTTSEWLCCHSSEHIICCRYFQPSHGRAGTRARRNGRNVESVSRSRRPAPFPKRATPAPLPRDSQQHGLLKPNAFGLPHTEAHCAREIANLPESRRRRVASYDRTRAEDVLRPARSRRPHAARQQVGTVMRARLDSAAKNRCAPVVPLATGRQAKPLKSHKMAQCSESAPIRADHCNAAQGAPTGPYGRDRPVRLL